MIGSNLPDWTPFQIHEESHHTAQLDFLGSWLSLPRRTRIHSLPEHAHALCPEPMSVNSSFCEVASYRIASDVWKMKPVTEGQMDHEWQI
jgi:hypothetical protein